MANKIKIKRGLVINLPTLDLGEPAFTTDEKKLYVGDGTSAIKVGSVDMVESGDNISLLSNDANYTSTGDNITLFTNDANYTSTGDNISLFTNDANYLNNTDTIDGGTF